MAIFEKTRFLLSVIIVNYNVRHFLEQCLFSVLHAIKDLDAEVIVVDNASSDGSREYLSFLQAELLQGALLQGSLLQGSFLQGALLGGRETRLNFIWNAENVGFAKANNQALAMAKGDYVLFLNPDTIVPEDGLIKCLAFMEGHRDAGALGVHMVDGSGRFLKESKRAYPTLATSFFKLCGLASVFPTSRIFGRYHLGHLDPAQTHEVDVLAGAFMMVRRAILDRTGGFDPDFFMYGEDIDLSYRIQKLGFRNFYFPETSIIHFKGESTKRGSLNYVKMFYQAMSIFVAKHYSGLTATIYRIAINIAIWARAVLSALANFIRHNGLPLVDAINTLISFVAATMLWNRFVKPETVYDKNLLLVAFPVFTLIFILVSYYAGLYDKQQKKGRVINSTIISVFLVLALYSLLPERFRFSRGILLLGSAFSFLLLSLNRILLKRAGLIEEEDDEKLATVIVGSQREFDEVLALFQKQAKEQRLLGRVAPRDDEAPKLTVLENLDQFVAELPVKEVIFCQGSISFKEIIERSMALNGQVRVRIHASGSRSVVGSDSSSTSGTTLSYEPTAAIGSASARRFKRLTDLLTTIFLFISLPLNVFIVKHPATFCRNLFQVLLGLKSWVGYCSRQPQHLPKIREGVIGTNGLPVKKEAHLEEGLLLLDELYAREYSVNRDLNLIIKGYKWLGT